MGRKTSLNPAQAEQKKKRALEKKRNQLVRAAQRQAATAKSAREAVKAARLRDEGDEGSQGSGGSLLSQTIASEMRSLERNLKADGDVGRRRKMTQRLEMLTKQLAIAKETEATEAAAEAARKQEEEKLIRSDPEAHGARVREAALALYRNNPTISFFYDPVMNPYGANPPGIAGEVYKTRDGKMTRNLDEALPFGEDETVGERRAREYKEGREKWEKEMFLKQQQQLNQQRAQFVPPPPPPPAASSSPT